MCGTIILGALGVIMAAKLAACGWRWRHAHGCYGYGGCHGGRGGRGGPWHHHHGGCGPRGSCGDETYDDGMEGDEREARRGRRGFGPERSAFARGLGRRWMLRWLSERLDATPGQEKVIAAALEAMEGSIRGAREAFHKSRETIAEALRGDEFGHDKIGDAWVSHDNAFEKVRLDLVTELQKIHEALDERQRKILADLITSGSFWG